MESYKKDDGIDLVIEGGSDYNNHMVAMVASKALHEAGFINTHRVYAPHGLDNIEKMVNTDKYVPSVLEVLRNYDPEVFTTPIIIAAHDPKPYPMERRRFDRPLLQAEAIARALSISDDPDDLWDNLHENEKHRLVRRLQAA